MPGRACRGARSARGFPAAGVHQEARRRRKVGHAGDARSIERAAAAARKTQSPSRFPDRAHASPSAFPEQASSIPADGAHRSAPALCPVPPSCPVLAFRAVVAVVEVALLPAPFEPGELLQPTTRLDARPAKASVRPGACHIRHLHQRELPSLAMAWFQKNTAPRGRLSTGAALARQKGGWSTVEQPNACASFERFRR